MYSLHLLSDLSQQSMEHHRSSCGIL